MTIFHSMDPTGKHMIDVGAPVVAAAAMADWLPPIAAALSAIWLLCRLFEYIRWVRRGRKPEEKP